MTTKTTFDVLADPMRREIATVFTTTQRVHEGTHDAGVVRVALTTSHNKGYKRLEVRLNREVLTDSGFVTRRFTVFAGPSADAGITLATQPVARFNANLARNLHQSILDDLLGRVSVMHGEAAATLRDLLTDAGLTLA